MELLKPPITHLESDKLLQNLMNKLCKAQVHVENLRRSSDEGTPPSQIYPHMWPCLPTQQAKLMLEGEKTILDSKLKIQLLFNSIYSY